MITKPDRGKKRIASVGMWDGVHAGHRYLIEQLCREGEARDLIPAVVTFDRHPLAVVHPTEAPALLSTLEDKEQLLAQAGVSDCIVLTFDERMRRLTAEKFLKMLSQKFGVMTLVLGFNNRLGYDQADNLELYRQAGAQSGMEVIQAEEYRGSGSPVSSSNIRTLLADGKVREAATSLGRPYRLHGKVVPGDQLGRQLGYPTANLQPVEENLLIPKPGVYAVRVVTPDGMEHTGMVNIGFRPTVAPGRTSDALVIEVHILDYTGYIYDEEIYLDFIDYLRPEKKFRSLERLQAQLAADEKKVRKIFAKK